MKEYKPIIIVLIKFFAVYLALIGLYYLYLNYYQNILSTCDPYTRIVAEQSSSLLNWIGCDSYTLHSNTDNYMKLFVFNKYTSIVNEGCNALSVIILYISFIIAFASTWKKTFLYLVITLIILHFFNIIRIVFINYIFYFYPQYGKEAHDYIFPSIIYGLIIVLWVIWIRFFVFSKKTK